MKIFLNIVVAVVIILVVGLKVLGIGFFSEEFAVECTTDYNVVTNESLVTCTVEDPNNLITDDYPLTLSLINSSLVVISEHDLTVGENNITFDELLFNTQYTIKLSGYELNDDIYSIKEYYTQAISTIDDDFVLPVITKSDLILSDTTASFLLVITDTESVIHSIDIIVSDNGTLVETITLTDLSNLEISVDTLDELTEYQIDIEVTYQINDFDLLVDTLHDFSLTTLRTPVMPEASISIVSNDNATLVFSIDEDDMDATLVSYTVSLIDSEDTVIYQDTLSSNTITIDISSITLDYRIEVVSSYLLTGQSFTNIELATYNIATNENSNFFSVPNLNIVDITVPLENYSDYDDYFYTNLNAGYSTFRIECDATVDCADLVQLEPYSSVPFQVIGMVHSFYDTKNIGYSFTPSYIDVTITYVYTPAEIAAITNEVNNIINSQTNSGMTTNQKILAVHDYIVNLSVYDTACYDNALTCDNDHNAYGILFDQNGVCEGYAHAMDITLRAMRIPSIRISSDTHQWNGVYVDGSWLHLDATWDDPVSSGGEDILSHDYFLISSSTLSTLDTSESHTYDHSYLTFMD